MLNIIWLTMMVLAVVVAIATGNIANLVISVTESAKFAFTLGLGLAGIMTLWLGLMRIAEAAGLIDLFTRGLRPILIKLFPDVPPEHPAMGAMSMNIAANILGLNNAATPFGLRAMEELEKINPHAGVATNTMCTFLALHNSNLQLVPTTAIALLAASGALHPTDIILPLLLSSICAIISAIVLSKLLQRLRWYRYTPNTVQAEGVS